MISGMLLKNKGTRDKDIKQRTKKSFSKERTLIEGTTMQQLDGPFAFQELETDSYKYRLDCGNNK